MRKKKKTTNNLKDIFILLLILSSLITLNISVFNIIKWKIDSNKTNEKIDEIQQISEVIEIEDTENIEIIEQEEIQEFNPYWDYIKMNLINVNFEDLKNINSETVGWIQVNGTNINYPFVQGRDNEYYLTHSIDKTYNSAGWVFLDYRNNKDKLDKNTIIYAHGMHDKKMFGSLRNILSSGWQNNNKNFVIKMSTENENTLWQVFSVYRIPTTSDYLKIDFESETEFISFANMLIDRSDYDFNTAVNKDDNILTLSTCYNKTDKVVLHAKLIKKETR